MALFLSTYHHSRLPSRLQRGVFFRLGGGIWGGHNRWTTTQRQVLTTSRSTGQCEGHICRVKLIKRIEYCRAKPVLLRQRGIGRLRSINISTWRCHCLRSFSIPFAKFAEDPTNWVHLTPAVISNIHEGKKLPDHFGVVADFSDQHYQQHWPVPAGSEPPKACGRILTKRSEGALTATVVSWNIATRREPWRQLLGMDADIALLQEATPPPDDLAQLRDATLPLADHSRPLATKIVGLSFVER